MKRFPLPVHNGVVENGALVPECSQGAAAYRRAALTVQTTVPSGVTCKCCLKRRGS
jgi:hypothetical protein